MIYLLYHEKNELNKQHLQDHYRNIDKILNESNHFKRNESTTFKFKIFIIFDILQISPLNVLNLNYSMWDHKLPPTITN